MVFGMLAAMTLSLVFLRFLPKFAGWLWGRRARIWVLLSGLLVLCLAWLDLADAHRDICDPQHQDAKTRCEISFLLLAAMSTGILIAVMSQIPFAFSVFAPERLRHRE
jgi:hypothetical protein